MHPFEFGAALSGLAKIIQNNRVMNLEYLGLGSGQKSVLSLILKAPGINQTAISVRLGIHKSVISRAVKVLLAAGYVYRKPMYGRSRARGLFSTWMAITLSQHIHSAVDQLDGQLTDGFSDGEKEQFKEYIQRAKINLTCQPAKSIVAKQPPVDF